MLSAIKRFVVEEEGISSVEYAILLSFIAAGLILVVTGLRDNVKAAFNQACTALGTPCPG